MTNLISSGSITLLQRALHLFGVAGRLTTHRQSHQCTLTIGALLHDMRRVPSRSTCFVTVPVRSTRCKSWLWRISLCRTLFEAASNASNELRLIVAGMAPTQSIPVHAMGSQGFRASCQGLGCMGMSSFYKDVDHQATEEESIAVIDRALELGVTLLDTSDVYGTLLEYAAASCLLTSQRVHTYAMCNIKGYCCLLQVPSPMKSSLVSQS